MFELAGIAVVEMVCMVVFMVGWMGVTITFVSEMVKQDWVEETNEYFEYCYALPVVPYDFDLDQILEERGDPASFKQMCVIMEKAFNTPIVEYVTVMDEIIEEEVERLMDFSSCNLYQMQKLAA